MGWPARPAATGPKSKAIKTAKGVDGALTVPMRLSETGRPFMVEAAGGSGGPAGVFVLRVARASTVQILRGENAGRSVTYTNVVRAINKLGDWSGQTATFDMPGTARDGEGFIVLVQKVHRSGRAPLLPPRKPKDCEASGREKRPSSPHRSSLRAASNGGRAPNFRRSAVTMPFACRAHGI